MPAVEFATLEWVSWFNHHRLLEPIGLRRGNQDEKSASIKVRRMAWAGGSCFVLRAKRDHAAARCFFEQAIGLHGVPEKITIDKSGANTAALQRIRADS